MTNNLSNNSIKPVHRIIREYRESRSLSLREFSKELVAGLPDETLSHQAVTYWENGAQSPSFSLLVVLALKTTDWRREFAVDCMAALKPATFQPAGEIGKRILQVD